MVRRLLFKFTKTYIYIFPLSIVKRFPLYLHFHALANNHISNFIVGILLFVPSLIYYFYKRFSIVISKQRDGVAGVFIVKNEEYYIEELIKYYFCIGFSKLIFYDNGSTDSTLSILEKYSKTNNVSVFVAKGKERQKDVYNDAINRFGKRYKYFTFFDADEFLRLDGRNSFNTINGIFNKFKNKKIGAIGVNMFIYGTSGHKTRPDGYVIQNYVYRSPDDYHANFHTKCIVDAKYLLSMHNPHTPFLTLGRQFLSCSGDLIPWTKSNKVDTSTMILNHYYTKSIEEYCQKRTKGDALNSTNVKNNIRTLHKIDDIEKNQLLDNYLSKYAEYFNPDK